MKRSRKTGDKSLIISYKVNPDNSRYGFQGSFAEDETELRGTVAFELRDWDPVIGRWTAVDPYRQFHSPYVGMGNNPVSNVDPDGGCTGNDPDCQNVGGYESSSMKYDAGLDAYVLQGSAVASAGMSAQQASQARFNSHVYGAGAAFWDHEVTQATVFAASFLIGAEAYLLARGFQGAKAAVRGVGLVDDAVNATSKLPELGRKLNYLLGKATGARHNIDRSTGMLRQLNSIGIYDNATGRAMLRAHFGKVVNDPTNIAKVQANGRVVRESLLAGPNGLLKVNSVWEGDRLITTTLIGR